MKILTLLEAPYQTNVVDKNYSKNLNRFRQKVGSNDTHGAFSKVKPDADPHMVRKSSREAYGINYTEGFKAFVMFLINNEFTDNPHFPRVYEVKTIKGKDGYTIDTFKSEKLVMGKDIDQPYMFEYIKSLSPEATYDGWEDDEVNHNHLALQIFEAVNNGTRPFTSDELNDACYITKRALHWTGGQNDIHGNNIMFRRGPHGIQVVINDPIYIRGS